MPVQWLASGHRPERPAFVDVRAQRIVLMVEVPERFDTLMLHYLPDRKTSRPCMGRGECTLCPQEAREYTYAPCWWWDLAAHEWRKGILGLGEPGEKLTTQDLRGKPIMVDRKKRGNMRSRIVFAGFVRDLTPFGELPVENFEIRPALLRRWGLYYEADKPAVEPYYEQDRLPFSASKQASM